MMDERASRVRCLTMIPDPPRQKVRQSSSHPMVLRVYRCGCGKFIHRQFSLGKPTTKEGSEAVNFRPSGWREVRLGTVIIVGNCFARASRKKRFGCQSAYVPIHLQQFVV